MNRERRKGHGHQEGRRDLAPARVRRALGRAGRSAGGRRRFLLADRLRPAARPGRYEDVSQSGRPDAFRRPFRGAFHSTKQVLTGDVAMVKFEMSVGSNTSMASTSSAAMRPGAAWSSG